MFFRKIVLIFLLLPLILINKLVQSWHQSIEFDFTIQPPVFKPYFGKDEVRMFESVYGSRDYFALLSSSLNRNNYFDVTSQSQYIQIGARNYFYRLSIPHLTPISHVRWISSQIDKIKCISRSVVRNKDECDNYIKVFLKLSKTTVKICSTNALNPKCRYYRENEYDINNSENHQLQVLQVLNETSGLGLSPLKAYENNYFYHYDEDRSNLYTGNSIDLNGYFTSVNRLGEQDRLTTNVDDNNWIYRADFVKSFTTDERIFVVFNEDKVLDVDSNPSLLQAPQRIPRIAHLCLNDRGASLNSLRNIWTTYLKSKLSCFYDTSKHRKSDDVNIGQMGSFKLAVDSSSIFYFDEIKSTSELHKDPKSGESYFYAVFTTSSNQITASAICRFTMSQIMSSFHGPYQQQQQQQQQQQTVPDPRPSQCPNTLTYQHLIFARKNFIMEQEVQSEAFIVESASESQFVSIDVDFNVADLENSTTSDMIFIGTDNGKVLVLSVRPNLETKPEVVYSEQLSLFDDRGNLVFNATNTSVRANNEEKSSTNETESGRKEFEFEPSRSIMSLKYWRNDTSHLIAMTQQKVISLPWRFCELKLDASKCNNSLYPYCVWFNGRCLNAFGASKRSETRWNQTNYVDTYTEKSPSAQMQKQNITSDYLPPNLLDKLSSDLSSLNSYKIRNNEITISMNLALFSTILILLLIFSIIFAVLLFLAISDKFITKRGATSGTAENPSLDALKDLFSFFHSSSSSSSSSTQKKIFSVEEEATIRSQVINDSSRNESERYVSLNPSRPLHVNLGGQYSQCELPSKFLDYDQTEYFSLKKNKPASTTTYSSDLIKLESTASSSLSSSPKSSTSSSSVSVTKSTFINANSSSNNEDAATVKTCSTTSRTLSTTFENGVNKYYL